MEASGRYTWNGVCFIERDPAPHNPPSFRRTVALVAMRCGVYRLLRAGIVIYVGASRCYERRLAQHRYNGMEFDQAIIDEYPEADLDRNEMAAIRRYRPTLNENNAHFSHV